MWYLPERGNINGPLLDKLAAQQVNEMHFDLSTGKEFILNFAYQINRLLTDPATDKSKILLVHIHTPGNIPITGPMGLHFPLTLKIIFPHRDGQFILREMEKKKETTKGPLVAPLSYAAKENPVSMPTEARWEKKQKEYIKLFSNTLITAQVPIAVEAATASIETLQQEGTNDGYSHYVEYAESVIKNMLFPNGVSDENLQTIIKGIDKLLVDMNVMQAIGPGLIQLWPTYSENSKGIDSAIDAVIAEYRRRKQELQLSAPYPEEEIMGTLLNMLDAKQITHQEVRGHIKTDVFAAVTTTAESFVNVRMYLNNHPEKQRIMNEEVDAFIQFHTQGERNEDAKGRLIAALQDIVMNRNYSLKRAQRQKEKGIHRHDDTPQQPTLGFTGDTLYEALNADPAVVAVLRQVRPKLGKNVILPSGYPLKQGDNVVIPLGQYGAEDQEEISAFSDGLRKCPGEPLVLMEMLIYQVISRYKGVNFRTDASEVVFSSSGILKKEGVKINAYSSYN
jgi:cytochrome P450